MKLQRALSLKAFELEPMTKKVTFIRQARIVAKSTVKLHPDKKYSWAFPWPFASFWPCIRATCTIPLQTCWSSHSVTPICFHLLVLVDEVAVDAVTEDKLWLPVRTKMTRTNGRTRKVPQPEKILPGHPENDKRWNAGGELVGWTYISFFLFSLAQSLPISVVSCNSMSVYYDVSTKLFENREN